MPDNLAPVIAATTKWLVGAYPAAGDALSAMLAETQARQAVTVAAFLRYPTPVDTAIVVLVGPGGAAELDWAVGADTGALPEAEHAWRTWVDEVVASWAACLLGNPALAARAVAVLHRSGYPDGLCRDFRRLTAPDERDRRAAPLLRHPDLLAPVAERHHLALLDRLQSTCGTA